MPRSEVAELRRYAAWSAVDYDLAQTLTSGQVFRWTWRAGGWEGVVGERWTRLVPVASGLEAWMAEPMGDGAWLREFLQLDVVWAEVMATLPDDLVMRRSVAACRGLRVLAQPPWECLASFVLSSTKRISQIRQIIGLLCQRFGAPVITPPGHETTFGFPTAEALAGATERELRDCKAGFRAPYLRSVAEAVACGQFVLADLTCRSLPEARAELMRLPGVGRKIADCVLLFSLGYREAFPVDTWVLRALRAHYFGGRHVSLRQVLAFAETYFGPWAGYAQQYLFHAARLASQRSELTEPGPPAPAIDPGRSDESPR